MLTFCFNAVDGLMTETETLTSGMVGKIVKLEFSSDWDNLQKTAVFVAGPTTKDVLNVTDEAVIPHEVLQNYGERLYVGIYGVAGDGTVTPTIYARGPRISRGADPSGDESAEASPPVWAQLQAQIDDLKNGGTGGGSGSDSTQKLNPVAKTADMTQPVGVDENGQLYTAPGGGALSATIEGENLIFSDDSTAVVDGENLIL